ncbi:hypothetical protein [Devosia sp. A369]
MSRFPWVMMILLLLLAAGSLSGVAVFAGLLRGWAPGPLVAEVQLQQFRLPAGFGIDPPLIAGHMVTQLKDRVDKDVALSVILGTEGARQLREVVVPRLVHPDLIARMMDNIPPLKTLTEVQNYRSSATVSVHNEGATVLTDVALTLPGTLRAETAEGPLTIVTPVEGLQTIILADLQPNEIVVLEAWQDRRLDIEGALDARITVGAAGVDGTVVIYGRQEWAGQAFETNVWGRWAAWIILIGVAAGSLGLLVWLVVRAVYPARP